MVFWALLLEQKHRAGLQGRSFLRVGYRAGLQGRSFLRVRSRSLNICSARDFKTTNICSKVSFWDATSCPLPTHLEKSVNRKHTKGFCIRKCLALFILKSKAENIAKYVHTYFRVVELFSWNYFWSAKVRTGSLGVNSSKALELIHVKYKDFTNWEP